MFPLRQLTGVATGLILARLLRTAICKPRRTLVDVHALTSVGVEFKTKLTCDRCDTPEGSIRVYAFLVACTGISRFALIDVLKGENEIEINIAMQALSELIRF